MRNDFSGVQTAVLNLSKVKVSVRFNGRFEALMKMAMDYDFQAVCTIIEGEAWNLVFGREI